jgi:sporulation protein YlmC with PRC-barrel domain
MLKKHIAACLVTTALLAAPALAQTSSGSGSGASSAASSGKFLSEEKPNQWRASKLVGINVYGPNNEKVGDINEVLVDRNGRAEAVVIGVGGFLGLGEKDVALPFDEVRWSDTPNAARSTASSGSGASGTGTTASGGAASGSAGTAGTAGGAGMAGGTGTTGTAAGSGAGSTTGSTGTAASTRSSADRGYPDHAMISMTKDELKAAPSFRYAGSTSRDNAGSAGSRPAGTGASGMGTTTGAGTAAPGSTAPRQ